MNFTFNVNTDAIKKFSRTLESMGKSYLPKAIKETLNKTALDVKKTSMPKLTKADFVNRKENFFKANSKVEFAQNGSISSMKATIGFHSNILAGKDNYAVKDLEQQEQGGTIGGRSFTPLDNARQGNNYNKAVKPNNRLSSIRNIINARNQQGKNSKQKFVKAAIVAGIGGYVLSRNTLFRIISGKTTLKNKETRFKTVALYNYKKNDKVKVKSTHFMRDASLESASKMEDIFIKEATAQLNRIAK